MKNLENLLETEILIPSYKLYTIRQNFLTISEWFLMKMLARETVLTVGISPCLYGFTIDHV